MSISWKILTLRMFQQFSMFKMDALFSRFRKNESDNNLEITRVTPVVDLQKSMGFDFPESMELLWKFNFL